MNAASPRTRALRRERFDEPATFPAPSPEAAAVLRRLVVPVPLDRLLAEAEAKRVSA